MSAMNRLSGTLFSAEVTSASSWKRRRPALLGEKVDGERREAGRGEAPSHGTDVVGEAAVLVHDQNRAARLVGCRPCPLQLAALGTVEGDGFGRQWGWAGWG
jgi:hypothetical protein